MQWKSAVRQLKEFSRTSTIRHSSISFIGTAINGALGIIYFFYLARILNPDNFGRFTIAIGIITVGYSIFNLGLDQAIIRYKHDSDVPGRVFFLKLCLSFLAISLSFIIFGTSQLNTWIGLGIASQMLFALVVTILQSSQKYFIWSAFYVGANLFRFLLAFFLSSPSSLTNLLIYVFTPLLGFFAFGLIFPRLLPRPRLAGSRFGEFVRFNIHLSLSSIFSALASRIDQFFIAGFQSFSQAGFYSLSSQIASSTSQVVSAYSAVISPKFASLDSNLKNQVYLKKNLLFSIITSLLIIPTLILLGYVLFTFSHKNFSPAFPILLTLCFGYAIFLASIPLRDSLLYYYHHTKIFSFLAVVQLILSLITGFLIIQPFGPIGAAGSFLFVQLISLLIVIFGYVQISRTHHR